jgi:hypothetical protein
MGLASYIWGDFLTLQGAVPNVALHNVNITCHRVPSSPRIFHVKLFWINCYTIDLILKKIFPQSNPDTVYRHLHAEELTVAITSAMSLLERVLFEGTLYIEYLLSSSAFYRHQYFKAFYYLQPCPSSSAQCSEGSIFSVHRENFKEYDADNV